jgi:hypothetical protein
VDARDAGAVQGFSTSGSQRRAHQIKIFKSEPPAENIQSLRQHGGFVL